MNNLRSKPRSTLYFWAIRTFLLAGLLAAPACRVSNHAPSAAPPAVSLNDTASFREADQYVVDQLLAGTDRGEWVDQWLSAKTPPDTPRRLVRLNLMVRDGRWGEARDTLRAFMKHANEYDRGRMDDVAAFLIDWGHDNLAREVIENYPQRVPRNIRRMWGRWQERVGTPEVDDWLAARQAATYEIDHQRGPNPYISQQQDVGYWISQRVNFINDHASHAALLDECYRRAQAAPQHLQHVFDWIYIAQVRPPKPAAPEGGLAVLFPEPEPLPMADWIVGYAEQLSAYHAYVLGKRVERSPWPDVAARVLEHALATPYTDADQSVLRRITRTCVNGLYRAMPTREQQERSLRRETRAALARAYVKSGQAERAQPILEALIAEYGDDLPRSLITLSGQTQSATGQRVIQNRILDAEPESQDKP